MLRLAWKFLLPLAAVLLLIAYLATPRIEHLMTAWFVRDLDARANLVARTLEVPLREALQDENVGPASALLQRIVQDERLLALGYCSPKDQMLVATDHFPRDQVSCRDADRIGQMRLLRVNGQRAHLAFLPLVIEGGRSEEHPLSQANRYGTLLVLHDASYTEHRAKDSRLLLFGLLSVIGVVSAIITMVIAQLSWRQWLSSMRSLLIAETTKGAGSSRKQFASKELKGLVNELKRQRQTREESQITWSPEALRGVLKDHLVGDEIMIVSNREPYIHTRQEGKIVVRFPASGLISALEPVMRACSGTWIAHGSGVADREVVDRQDRVAVPPQNPKYQLRRVWLTKEQEEGYYYGFSNEGLWPLCHIAHVRPTFRSEDWKKYVEVNREFAKAVIEEARTENPIILVQDYHFALLPRFIRQKLPKATIIAFWHIPWPNPESFGICPWREEILDGMLGANILGFHTRFHCNNFIASVERYLEARIDHETQTISYGQKLTAVSNYPISIEWPSRWLENQHSIEECGKRVRERFAIPTDVRIGTGVDRLDYTKGILERFSAIERLFERWPEWIGRVSFLQIAAPSRSRLEQYQQFENQVRNEVRRINGRFGKGTYQPIILCLEHYDPYQVMEVYRASDFCFVSSLHDGMNLVAKEYVAAREDERGALILSQFTGAARELLEALIVNPYNSDQCADAIQEALEMPEDEQRDRMRSMRGFLQDHNVYRWAGKMLLDAARIRKRQRLLGRLRIGKARAAGIIS